jgi:DNA-binding response OmpR family regulator
LNLLLSPPNQPSYRDERLYVDLRRRLVIFDSEVVTLTRMQYRVLALLVEHAGEVVPRAIILKRIWGGAPKIQLRTVDKHVNVLRRKLGIYANLYIETVIGVGYRFRPLPGR